MILRSASGVILVLAATAVLAQSAQPGTAPSASIPRRQSPVAQRGPGGATSTDPLGLGAARENVQDMESTVSQMRVVLKQMHAKAAKNTATDSLTKANFEMWGLMVGELENQLQQLRETLAERENMEARRVDLYKQADAKIAARAQAARAAQAARFAEAANNATGTPTAAPTGQSAEQKPGAQTLPAQPSAAPSTNNSASPN
jgi:ribulose bisphosphate carboxylase small subunit